MSIVSFTCIFNDLKRTISVIELITIRFYAKEMKLTESENLRALGMKRQVDRQAKVLYRKVLQLVGMLDHMAANLNRAAYKRNHEMNYFQSGQLKCSEVSLKEF